MNKNNNNKKPIQCRSNSIFEIPIEFFITNNIEFLLTDLDNTLDLYIKDVPSNKTINFVNKLVENNIKLIIISNNNEKRVKKYAKILNVNYLSRAKKPFVRKVKKYLQINNINMDKSIFIGDQYLTDVSCAKKT